MIVKIDAMDLSVGKIYDFCEGVRSDQYLNINFILSAVNIKYWFTTEGKWFEFVELRMTTGHRFLVNKKDFIELEKKF